MLPARCQAVGRRSPLHTALAGSYVVTMKIVRLGSMLGVVGGLVACADQPPPPTLYTAAQLNSTAVPASTDDDFGPPPAPPAPYVAPEAPPPPPRARVRVLHANTDRAAASVDVYLGTVATPVASAVAYKSLVGPVEAPTGEHDVAVRVAGAANTAAPAIAGRTPALEDDTQYTAIAYGAGGTSSRLAFAHDDLDAPDAGTSRVRFFHALNGTLSVDLCTVAAPGRPARAVFANVAFGAFGDYTAVPAGGPLTLQIRPRGPAAARPCSGPLRGSVSVTVPDGAVLTAVAVGRPAGPNPVPRELLVCTDRVAEGPPSCTAVAIR